MSNESHVASEYDRAFIGMVHAPSSSNKLTTFEYSDHHVGTEILDDHRYLVEELYIKRNLTPEKIAEVLSSKYNFRTSKGQVRNKIAEWGLKKSMKSKYWVRLHQKIQKRKALEKDSIVIINGCRIDATKLRKEFSRNVRSVDMYRSATENNALSPGPCEVRTPLIQTTANGSHHPLPWHQFLTSIEAIDLSVLPFGLRDLCNLVPASKPMDMRSSRMPRAAQALCDRLRFTVIEPGNESTRENVGSIFRGGRQDALCHFFRYVIYLVSNNLDEGDLVDHLVRSLAQNNLDPMVVRLLSSREPTIAATRLRFIEAAIHTEHIGLLQELLTIESGQKRASNIVSAVLEWLVRDSADEEVVRQVLRILNPTCEEILKHADSLMFSLFTDLPPFSPCLIRSMHSYGVKFSQLMHGPEFRFIFEHDRTNKTEIWEALWETDIDINYPQLWVRYGSEYDLYATILQMACWYGETGLVKQLLCLGADADGPAHERILVLQNKGNDRQNLSTLWTPLTLAVMKGFIDIAEMLIKAGADVNLSLKTLGAESRSAVRSPTVLRGYDVIHICIPLEAAMASDTPVFFQALLHNEVKIDIDHFQHLYEIAVDIWDCTCLEILYAHLQAGADDPEAEYLLLRLIKQYYVRHNIVLSALQTPFPQHWSLVNLHMLTWDDPAFFLCQIALASMCRHADSCMGDSGPCAPFGNKGAVLECTATLIIQLLNNNITYRGCPISEDLWGKIEEHLLVGLPTCVPHLLSVAHQLDDYDLCSLCASDRGPKAAHPINSEHDRYEWTRHRNDLPKPLDVELPVQILNMSGIKLMLEHGIDLSSTNHQDCLATPLEVADYYGDSGMARLLAPWVASDSGSRCDIERACLDSQFDLARDLLLSGAQLSGASLSTECWESIMRAVWDHHQHFDFVLMLLAAGLDVNSDFYKNGIGSCVPEDLHPNPWDTLGDVWIPSTLLQWFAMADRPDWHDCDTKVECLLSYGADIDFVNDLIDTSLFYPTVAKSGTALQIAASRGRLSLVKLFLQYGADVNAPSSVHYGRTALQAALEQNNFEIVTQLLETGADINAPPARDHGVTALQAAAINGALPVAEMLIQRGADVAAAAAEVEGRTALEGAAERGRLDMLQLLLNHYQEPDWREACADAAELAEREGHFAASSFLRSYSRDW